MIENLDSFAISYTLCKYPPGVFWRKHLSPQAVESDAPQTEARVPYFFKLEARKFTVSFHASAASAGR